MEQLCSIVTSPLDLLNNDNIQDTANKLTTSLTLTVYSKKNEQLKFLVDCLLSSHLSDICYIDDMKNPMIITKLLENISEDEVQQITFLKFNKIINN